MKNINKSTKQSYLKRFTKAFEFTSTLLITDRYLKYHCNEIRTLDTLAV